MSTEVAYFAHVLISSGQNRKRKMIAPLFTQTGIVDFQPYLRTIIASMLRKWDLFCDNAPQKSEDNEDDEQKVYKKDDRAWFNCAECKRSSLSSYSLPF